MSIEIYSLLLAAQWIIPLWLSGWLLLPVSRRVFGSLPDKGLAAGKVLFLVLIGLFCCIAAACKLLPLTFSPLLIFGLPLVIGPCSWWAELRDGRSRYWIKPTFRGLLWSDFVFVVTFLAFLWLRLCRPEINEFEKPMDSAIIGSLSRAIFLPADNPWLAGEKFTNYYHFGHFLGALLTRSFGTPIPYAYNLVQPLFCALFVSTLWSLCTALCGGRLVPGALATAWVAFAGNFEPLRQWTSALKSSNTSLQFPYLDWWSTSRVVPHTINEYPLFTMALGDAHAHFFALSLAALLLCICFEISVGWSNKLSSGKHFVNATIAALVVGAVLLTNSWDFPLYLLVVASCILRTGTKLRARLATVLATACLAVLVAIPFLKDFKLLTGGLAFELWMPEPVSVLLFWGGHICLAIIAVLWPKCASKRAPTETFLKILAGFGLVAVLLPCVFYLQGNFSGDLRHQDTVFKFWLQGWLLFGTGVGCAGVMTLCRLIANGNLWKRMALGAFLLVFYLPTVLASWSVIAARSNQLPAFPAKYSLNGARHLSHGEQEILAFLRRSESGSWLIEPVGRDTSGSFVGAYGPYGRFAALSGVPGLAGWPQHARFWGAEENNLQARLVAIERLYEANSLDRLDAAVSTAVQLTLAERHRLFIVVPPNTNLSALTDRESVDSLEITRRVFADGWSVLSLTRNTFHVNQNSL